MPLVQASRHFYLILEAGSVPEEFDIAGSGTGLVTATGSAALVSTGTANGPVEVTVHFLQAPPARLASEWQEVAEVSLSSSGASFLLSNMDGEISEEITPPNGVGDYRLRVHARGRDDANQSVLPLETVLEHHLLQLWPAPPAPPTLLTGSDEFGAAYGRNLTPNA
jgi:hypothetical protein